MDSKIQNEAHVGAFFALAVNPTLVQIYEKNCPRIKDVCTVHVDKGGVGGGGERETEKGSERNYRKTLNPKP